jgi:SAM-dependent methyltransferase
MAPIWDRTAALAIIAPLAVLCILGANWVSYRLLKGRVLRSRRWDLNVSCGRTDGGGLNVDVVRHAALPNFALVADVCRLPYPDGAFAHVLSSHTIEHLPDPAAFYRELRRVGRRVTLLVPPLWDLGAAFNLLEHRWLFLTFRTRHDDRLPRFVRLPLAAWIQARLRLRLRA